MYLVPNYLLFSVASSQIKTAWTYFDEGVTREDPSFRVEERCQFYNDFRPIPQVRRLL